MKESSPYHRKYCSRDQDLLHQPHGQQNSDRNLDEVKLEHSVSKSLIPKILRGSKEEYKDIRTKQDKKRSTSYGNGLYFNKDVKSSVNTGDEHTPGRDTSKSNRLTGSNSDPQSLKMSQERSIQSGFTQMTMSSIF